MSGDVAVKGQAAHVDPSFRDIFDQFQGGAAGNEVLRQAQDKLPAWPAPIEYTRSVGFTFVVAWAARCRLTGPHGCGRYVNAT